VHRKLTAASQEAHVAAAQGNTERLAEIEARVDALASLGAKETGCPIVDTIMTCYYPR
jgi:hypothetical protein